VYVSESTTTVTVRDHPSNVKAIEDYITQLNRDMSREVAIQVEVLEIDLNKEFNYGINWNLVQHWLGTDVSLSAQPATAANITGIVSQGAAAENALAMLQIGKVTSNVIISALSQQGRVSVVTQPRVVTMNNQMAEIRITRDVSYLQSVSNTTTANSGNATNTTTLTPGIVTDGFSLYLLPKIQGNKVYLQISSSLSTLTSLNTVTNEPQPSFDQNGNVNQVANQNGGILPRITNNNPQNPQFQQIQVPTLAEKLFNQRTVISSGCTLVITGFQQTRDETQRSQLFGLKPLGGTGAARGNSQTLVLITPTILGKY
jgi:type IVB pilus formation R64 PilN family outer membrane protein